MKKVTVKSGKGLTARSEDKIVFEGDNPDDMEPMREWFESLGDRLNSPWHGNSQLINLCRVRLDELRAEAEARWAAEHSGQIYYENGKQQWLQYRVSEGWYLKEICTYATIVERCAESGRSWEAANRALLLGELINEFRISEYWNEFAIYGKKHLSGLREAAQDKQGWSLEKRASRVAERLRTNPNKEQAYRMVAKEEGVSPSTIKKSYLAFTK
tara:strand:+ start:98 stop:739 length:642 start_codon:yes stop_codon:yes gene_type:complete